MRGSLAAKQRVGEEPRGHLEMLEGSVAIHMRAVSGLGTQMCGPGRRRGGLEMRHEEEGGVRRDSDNETEAQRGLVMGPQPHSQGVKPQARHLYEATAWPAALAAAPHRDAHGAEGRAVERRPPAAFMASALCQARWRSIRASARE